MGKIVLYWMQRQALKRLQIQRKGRMDMTSLCGSDCCGKCPRLSECGGCQKTEGRPFGGRCVAAEWVKTGGLAHFEQEKSRLIAECNALGIQGLALADLNLLNGFYVNLEYTLPNGTAVKLLEDDKVYLGNQIERAGSQRCYGIVGDESHILVCEYGCGGADPEILLYKKR